MLFRSSLATQWNGEGESSTRFLESDAVLEGRVQMASDTKVGGLETGGKLGAWHQEV